MKDKDIITEFILCLFLGYFGAHKFYERKIGLGILYLFTFGLCGIGWLIDLIVLFFKIPAPDDRKKQCVQDLNNFQNTPLSIDNNLKFAHSSYFVEPVDDFVSDYIVFDFETTGLSPLLNKIIEIGALKYKNNVLVDSFNKLVNPQCLIPNNITNLTGISNSDVADAKLINEILPEFIKFIDDYTLVAHNNSFDLKFLLENLYNQQIPCIKNRTIDTLALSKKFLPELENHKLETLKKYLNINCVSHRALSDCEVTNAVYQYCKEKDKNKK